MIIRTSIAAKTRYLLAIPGTSSLFVVSFSFCATVGVLSSVLIYVPSTLSYVYQPLSPLSFIAYTR